MICWYCIMAEYLWCPFSSLCSFPSLDVIDSNDLTAIVPPSSFSLPSFLSSALLIPLFHLMSGCFVLKQWPSIPSYFLPLHRSLGAVAWHVRR
jgi:hypothetical protein